MVSLCLWWLLLLFGATTASLPIKKEAHNKPAGKWKGGVIIDTYTTQRTSCQKFSEKVLRRLLNYFRRFLKMFHLYISNTEYNVEPGLTFQQFVA
jgi:hypothetical protein